MRFANGICLITEDVKKLSDFYQEVLQVKVETNDIHVNIILDGGGITIYSKAAAEKDMGFDFSQYNGTGLCKITFFVEDIDNEYKRLQSLNVQFMTPPTLYPWGTRSMHFRDLDGNIVCFVNLPK